MPSFRAVRVLVVLSVSASIFTLGTVSASAHCTGDQSYGNIGAKNQHNPTYGSRMRVWVNNFDNHQFDSWRSITAWQNSNNNAEVGWFTAEYTGDQKAHPYKTRVNNSIATTIEYPGQDITPRDDFHTFIVQDLNDDNQYVSSYDGNTLGDPWFVSADVSVTESQTQSERRCTSDSLWSEFRNLQYYNANGNNVDWADKVHNSSINKAPYQYCNVGPAAYDVKQNC